MAKYKRWSRAMFRSGMVSKDGSKSTVIWLLHMLMLF